MKEEWKDFWGATLGVVLGILGGVGIVFCMEKATEQSRREWDLYSLQNKVERLADQVVDGELTQAQADRLARLYRRRIDRIIGEMEDESNDENQ